MSMKTYTTILLAAQRPGITNPIAEHYNVSHKCLAPVNGIPMVERVLTTLLASDHIEHVVLSIEDPDILRALPMIEELYQAGAVSFAESKKNLSASVIHAIQTMGGNKMPFLITTADNCFHTTEMIDHFLNDIDQANAEAAWGMAADTLVQDTYPGTGKITGQHKLRDGIWSNCNIYAVCSERALASIEIFKGGGQFGNKKKRKAMIPMIGFWAFFLYRYGLVSLNGLAAQASRVFKIRAHAVKMPFADAPIDADDLPSLQFIEQNLIEREGKATI